MSTNSLRGAVEWALMIALVFGAGAIAQAQDDAQADGPVIQIGKSDTPSGAPQLPPPNQGLDGSTVIPPGFPDQPQQELPKYWIGLLGGAIGANHPLRAHVDFPENQGLLVAEVVPNSPAEKAGLKQHDILLRANDTDLHEMSDLVEFVLTEGEKKGQITLDVLHHGQRETVYLTPAERPADAPRPQLGGGGGGGEFGLPGGIEMPGELLREFGGNLPFEFRNFGPGVIVGGGGQGVANIPNGVSVSIQKQDGQPAQITVKRGEETWEVVGDDPESLNQLPDDLRPFVEQMLHNGAGPRGFNLRGLPNIQAPLPELGDGRLRERLERMERRMQELQERLGRDIQPAEEAQDGGNQTE